VLDRLFSGTLMTSIAMAGVSVTVLKLEDKNTLELLDFPAKTPAWPAIQARVSGPGEDVIPDQEVTQAIESAKTVPASTAELIRKVLSAISEGLVASEAEITALDLIVGDGDCGITMKAAGNLIREGLANGSLTCDQPTRLLSQLANTVGENMGGSSGALYSIFLHAGATQLKGEAAVDSSDAWARAFQQGCRAISTYGGAQAGDRTMLDALLPAAETFSQQLSSSKAAAEAFSDAAAAAVAGAKEVRSCHHYVTNTLTVICVSVCRRFCANCDKTRTMAAKAGRSSYIDPQRIAGTADPGATAAGIWLLAAASALN